MARRKTEYMKLIEKNEQEDLEIKQKEELRKQLITDNEEKIKNVGGQCKLRAEEEIKGCDSVVLKPAKKGNPSSRVAINGVHCLGKKIDKN